MEATGPPRSWRRVATPRSRAQRISVRCLLMPSLSGSGASTLLQYAFRRGGIFLQQFGRSTGPGDQLAAAVRAQTRQYMGCTICTERTLERTDARDGRVGWEIDVTAFAVGSELKHCIPRGRS